MDVTTAPGSSTVEPEIIALAQAFLTASPEITLPQAVKAAYFFHNTGQVEGRDSYIGTSGRVTGKVLEGYRGVARDAAERNVGEVQIKYRPLTADEAAWNDVQPGDLARACEVYQLRAWRIAQKMGQPYEPIIGIGIVKPGEKTDSNGKPIPLIGGMTWGKKCQNRAYKDAMRHVPGMAINGAEVLEDAEERDIHVEVPQGAQLTREQAIALVAEAERLSIAPPQPMNEQQAAATLAQNNARTRGTGPDWQGFGDDDERPAKTPQDAANDAAFEQLPSASAERAPADRYEGGKAERAGGNGKQPPANGRPQWKDADSAIDWGNAQGCFDHRNHAENAWNKVVTAIKAEHAPAIPTYAWVFDAWYADVQRRVLDHNAKIDAELDAQAAAQS